MHTLNSNALLEDLLFRCYHIYNINLTKGMKEMVNKLEQLSQTAISDLLLKLEAKLDADVFTYYGEIVNGVEREVKDFIEALAKDSHKHDSIYIFLTTPGGSLTPVQRMVDIFRHFYDEVNFIVPDYAYSAGTIWCMSGDNIYMNYYSTLGPIDPQVPNKEGHLVAALGYLDKINELLDKAKRNELTQAEFLILKDFDLAELRSYEQAKELAIDMLKKWLTTYKFKDWTIHSDGSAVTQEEKEQRALEIASKLSDNNVWKSHGRPIGIQVLKNDLHLEIVDFEKDSELNEIINEYYDGVSEYIKNHDDNALYASMRATDYVRYHAFLKGYMMRISAVREREPVRVSKEAVSHGINFAAVGHGLINAYRKRPEVEAVSIYFVTEQDIDYIFLKSEAHRCEQITDSLNNIFNGLTMDCSTCSSRELCDEIDGLRQLHMSIL